MPTIDFSKVIQIEAFSQTFSDQYYSKLKAILSELFPESYWCNNKYTCVSGNFTSFVLEKERISKSSQDKKN